MINKFEVQVDPKACKYYLDAFDVIFVDDQHDLRFCRYCKHPDASISGKYHMVVKDNYQIFDYITRDTALCYYDRDHHRWCSKVSDHSTRCWEVVGPEDDVFINVLVGIAIDEISGNKTELSADDITHRIKSRFGIWYDEYTKKRSWDSLANRADKFFNEFVGIPQTRNNSYRYLGKCVCGRGIRVDNSYDNLQLPIAKFVQFNGDYTTVVWKDGSHTTVKRAEGECYDEEKAVLFAIVKHLCKDNGCAMTRYFDNFYKHSRDISNDKEKKNGSNKKANTKRNSGKA